MVMCKVFDLPKVYVFHDIEEMKKTIIPLAIETGKMYKVTELGKGNRVLGWVRPNRFDRDSARFIPTSQGVDPRKLLDQYDIVDLLDTYSSYHLHEEQS